MDLAYDSPSLSHSPKELVGPMWPLDLLSGGLSSALHLLSPPLHCPDPQTHTLVLNPPY